MGSACRGRDGGGGRGDGCEQRRGEGGSAGGSTGEGVDRGVRGWGGGKQEEGGREKKVRGPSASVVRAMCRPAHPWPRALLRGNRGGGERVVTTKREVKHWGGEKRAGAAQLSAARRRLLRANKGRRPRARASNRAHCHTHTHSKPLCEEKRAGEGALEACGTARRRARAHLFRRAAAKIQAVVYIGERGRGEVGGRENLVEGRAGKGETADKTVRYL